MLRIHPLNAEGVGEVDGDTKFAAEVSFIGFQFLFSVGDLKAVAQKHVGGVPGHIPQGGTGWGAGAGCYTLMVGGHRRVAGIGMLLHVCCDCTSHQRPEPLAFWQTAAAQCMELPFPPMSSCSAEPSSVFCWPAH